MRSNESDKFEESILTMSSLLGSLIVTSGGEYELQNCRRLLSLVFLPTLILPVIK